MVRLGRDAVRPAPRAVREPGQVRGALPRRLHLRGDRPDARLVLLADRDLHAAVRPVAVPDRPLPRPHRRRRGQEDVQVAGEHHPAVGGHRPPRRRRVPLVLPHLQAAVGRLPVLHRRGRRVAAPVPAAAVEHVRLLRDVRERQRGRARRRRRAGQRPRRVGALAPQRDGRRRSPSASTTSTPPAAATRSRRSSTISRTGTSAAPAAASGTAIPPPSRRSATAS